MYKCMHACMHACICMCVCVCVCVWVCVGVAACVCLSKLLQEAQVPVAATCIQYPGIERRYQGFALPWPS